MRFSLCESVNPCEACVQVQGGVSLSLEDGEDRRDVISASIQQRLNCDAEIVFFFHFIITGVDRFPVPEIIFLRMGFVRTFSFT